MADETGLTPKDKIEIELEKAKIAAKRERETVIGTLLDKAASVLSDVLDSNDPALANQRMRAAEVAINLYIQQDNGTRQDRALEMQQRRLELEEEKLRRPGGALFQQNNVYVNGPQQPQTLAPTDDEQARLLARKQATNALLESFLPQKPQEVAEDTQATGPELSKDAVLNTEDNNSGDNT